ncbi:ubiquitin carboxyl-terminal hydrolase 37-like isoform X1 [Saccostrea echinata]|uniref:ubiquitin carboxyl-terminal hydrolase 37-like isoform X1 n=1 Tax=Saccostrea echinata TaxID=191078 RepID=UPI002A840278|nr:ubiquitin carboxyl-terminal hydrolase 37-like isoform X1 [Saccostrea echinata]
MTGYHIETTGELKYSGLESGTTSWKQGTMVLHCKDGSWKLDLYINCNRTGPVKSFQINSNSIKKTILKEKNYFIELMIPMRGGACNIYFRPDGRSYMKTRELDAVVQDIKNNKVEQAQTPCKDKSVISRSGLLEESPMSQNIKSSKQDIPQQFTSSVFSMKEPPSRRDDQVSLYCDEEYSENNGSEKENFLFRGLEKSDAITKQSCSVDTIRTPKFYNSSKHSLFTGYSSASVGSSSKKLELMPDPTPRLSTGVNYSWSKNKLSLPQKDSTQLSGFSNLGNTCYMNAILQSLFHLEPFTRDLVHISRKISRSLPQQSLYQSLVRLHGSRKRILSDFSKRDLLRNVKQAISSSAKRFSGYQQHDAHEFLNQVLDQLKEEVAKVMKSTPSPSRSPREITETVDLINPTLQNFEFEVTHTISCTNCSEKVTKAEQFYDLSLEMPRKRTGSTPCTIQNALDLFFKKEAIEYRCEKCGCCKAEVSHKFTRLPRVLILHLKRYNYNTASTIQSKMLQNIVIPKYLSLHHHCVEDTNKPYPISWPLPIPPSPQKSLVDSPKESTPRRKLDMNNSFRFKKSRVLPLFDSDEDILSSSPSKKQKVEDNQENSENMEKKREPFKTLTLADSQEDPDLAKALELSLQEANERAQQDQYGDEVDGGGMEESDFQKALEMSRLESAQPQPDHDYGSDLNGMSEEEQMRIAIEQSMREFEQTNYLPDPEEENLYKHTSDIEQTQQNKGGDIIKQCSALVYETCLQNGLENDKNQDTVDSKDKTVDDSVTYRSKYFATKEKCDVCDTNKAGNSAMEQECKCKTDASDCNGNKITSGKPLSSLNGGSIQQEGSFVPKLSTASDFKSMFDDEDFDQDVLLLDEPWCSSEDKENKKPSSPVEEDTCLIEELPIISNEKGDMPQSYRLVSVVNHIGTSSFVGHYISDVFDAEKSCWYSFDDSHVSKTTESEIRSSRERSGYIFFYLNKDIYEDLTQHLELTKHNTQV